jgi:hypothetical protein
MNALRIGLRSSLLSAGCASVQEAARQHPLDRAERTIVRAWAKMPLDVSRRPLYRDGIRDDTNDNRPFQPILTQ